MFDEKNSWRMIDGEGVWRTNRDVIRGEEVGIPEHAMME